jgi:hypothetical protein
MSIIVLATRSKLGTSRQQWLYLTRSNQGDTSWHLRAVDFLGPPGALSMEAAMASSTFIMAGSFPTLMHGLVDRMADWGASDDEIIPLADFIPRLEGHMQEVILGMQRMSVDEREP